MDYIHGSNIVQSWQELSLAAQMGNIGSEVSRAHKWETRDEKIYKNTVFRAIELLDLTISDKRWLTSVKEILRVKEVLCDYVFGEKQYKTSLSDLDRYFTQFALIERS